MRGNKNYKKILENLSFREIKKKKKDEKIKFYSIQFEIMKTKSKCKLHTNKN